ncbi:MAG: PQQ-dependent sugar dehydrogenase [Bacteroidota bacterium]
MKNVLFLVLILLLGCQTQQKESPNPHHPEKKVVFEGLNHPWSIAFLSEDEALVSEKDGDLVKIDLVSRTKTILKGFPKDLTDSIRAYSIGDNSGIFEVLLDPDFKKNQWVYFSYTAKKHGEGRTTKVVRAQLENDSLVNHQTLLVAEPFAREYFHFGGGMLFGPDRKLYITIGERLYWERDNPPMPNAQNPKDKRGKIYRINSDGSIPKDNPDFGEGAIPGIYAMGIRAAQGLTIHPETKAIWFSEHGTIQGDEINMLSAGANYGWPNVTSGKLRSPNYKPPKLPGVSFTSPVWFWPHTVAPTGLTFYTGADFPDWKNNLLVPGLSRGSLWRFRIENDTVKSTEELFIDDRVRIRKVRQSPQGKLYILTDEDDGKLIQIIPKTYSNSQ